jgi:hypothetical protein
MHTRSNSSALRTALAFAAVLALGFLLLPGCQDKQPASSAGAPQGPTVLKVAAKADGSLLLDGKPTDLTALDAQMATLEARGPGKGVVWYYREQPEKEPPPQAMRVVEMIMKHKLAISMSSKPDFSDYVDEQGVSHPRP